MVGIASILLTNTISRIETRLQTIIIVREIILERKKHANHYS